VVYRAGECPLLGGAGGCGRGDGPEGMKKPAAGLARAGFLEQVLFSAG